MFIIKDEKNQIKPIKVWLDSKQELEDECLRQAVNLSTLPGLHKWVALMPDTHPGFGMPIGGVAAFDSVIVPNAVGVDIGCGMAFTITDISASDFMKMNYPQRAVNGILERIPTGFEHHKDKRICKSVEAFSKYLLENPPMPSSKPLLVELKAASFQVGTLGGGNHFIEFQQSSDGRLAVMVHSGSRNLGYKIYNHFNRIAKDIRRKSGEEATLKADLAYFEAESRVGMEYIAWMNMAKDFAKESRASMLEGAKKVLVEIFGQSISFEGDLDCHHNYASLETHYSKDVWVHRKGAISARKGEMGIIPGALGMSSYIVEGLGNPESFNSSSHGAGRLLGRKQARMTIPLETTINDLSEKNITLGKVRLDDLSEESMRAYKNIDEVLRKENDLVKPVMKLETLAVIKG